MANLAYLKLDPDWLRQQYHGEHRTIAEMAELAGRARQTIIRAMEHHGIPRRAPGGKRLRSNGRHLNTAWLVHKHRIQGLSLVEMAIEAGVSQPTITNAMKRRHIPVLHWRDRQALRNPGDADSVCNYTCPHWRDCLDEPEGPCRMP